MKENCKIPVSKKGQNQIIPLIYHTMPNGSE
jgi:hypothetical protein